MGRQIKAAGWSGNRGTTTERGYGSEWRKLRDQVMRRDAGICQCRHCKASGAIKAANEVDHITPKAHGGTDDPSNLQAINRDCHKRKTVEDEGKQWRPDTGIDGWPVV